MTMSDETKCPTCNDLLPEYCPAHPQPVEPTPGGSDGPDEDSPLPWCIPTGEPGVVYDASGLIVADCPSHRDAAFIVRAVNASQRSEPVATGESDAWSVLRELVPLLYYNTTPAYIDAVIRARALLAKVDGGRK
jgi:hypothetical protein